MTTARRYPIVALSLVLIALGVPGWDVSEAAPLSQAQIDALPATTSTANCGGGVAAVNVTPPAGFEATTATAAELAADNFPPKPTDAPDLAAWTKYVTGPISRSSSCSNLVPMSASELLSRSQGQLPASQNSVRRAVQPDGLTRSSTSSNWAGYMATNYAYTDTLSAYYVPYPVSNSGDGIPSYSASWVGVNSTGSSADPIIQAGSESDGNSAYYLWWEAYPAGFHDVSSLTNGDRLIVHVHAVANSASFSIDDETSGFDHTYTYTGSFGLDGHAEWILERVNFDEMPEDSDTTFNSTDASYPGVSYAALSTLPYTKFTMTCSGQTLAQPGAVVNTNTFTDSWVAFGHGGKTC